MSRRTVLNLVVAVAASLAWLAPTSASAQVAGIKTNLLYDATATINAGAEVGINPQWSVDISGNLNLWTWKDNMKWKHWMLQPEIRHWTCQRFAGHFFGLHVIAGQFNIGNLPVPEDLRILGTNFGYLATRRYEGWGFGAGLAYGYALPISKQWNLEAEIGLGAIIATANSFDCDICNRPIDEGFNKILPGVTKAALSIVYLF